jgi:hypothetical protein
MTAPYFNPAVASRRAKYSDDFRVRTLLGAQPRSHKKKLAADAQLFFRWLFNTFAESLHCADHHPIWIVDAKERLVAARPVMT